MLIIKYTILLFLMLELALTIIGIISNINKSGFFRSPFNSILIGIKSHIRSFTTLIKFKSNNSYVVKSKINLSINKNRYMSILKEHRYYVNYLSDKEIELLEIDDGFYNASIRTWRVKYIKERNIHEVTSCEDEIDIKLVGSLTYLILSTLFFSRLNKIKCDEFSDYTEMNKKLKSDLSIELLKLIRDNSLEQIIN